MISNIQLQHVEYMPKDLETGILYVSKRFQVVAHLCACGCGEKVVTPLGPTEWSLTEKGDKATLYPSIGNWQFPCRSHYWIRNSKVLWSYQWTDDEIELGRKKEEERRETYYKKMKTPKISLWKRFLKWFRPN